MRPCRARSKRSGCLGTTVASPWRSTAKWCLAASGTPAPSTRARASNSYGPSRAVDTPMTLVRMQVEYFHPWPNDVGLFVARHSGAFATGLEIEITVPDRGRGDGLAY